MVGYYGELFKSLGVDEDGRIAAAQLASRLRESGISETDPRVTDVWAALRRGVDIEGQSRIDLDRFIGLCKMGGGVVTKSIKGDFAIPDFGALQSEISGIYESLRHVDGGHVADCIPQLGRVNSWKRWYSHTAWEMISAGNRNPCTTATPTPPQPLPGKISKPSDHPKPGTPCST